MMARIKKLTLGLGLALAATWSPDADAKFVFPYNHPDLEWYTIETEHFRVHYPVSRKTREEGNEHYINAEFSARKSAKIAEEMWAPMCAQFNYFLKERINIVLLDQSDELEGFTIPSWDWIEISANPGGYFYRMRGRMEWFSDVLVHEFAHVVSLKANEPFGEGIGGVLLGGLYNDGIRDAATGAEIMISGGEPFWWTEGGAEYWSDNAGYNWWSSSRDMNIRTTVLENRLLTYDEWVNRVDKRDWGDGERGYQQGYSIALYLRERFGDETYARFALEYGKGWRVNWETVIEDVLGVDAETLYNDWVAYLTEKYTAVYDQVKAEGEVAGYEMSYAKGGWEYRNASERDEWLSERERDREDEREATGTWALEPRYSADGRFYGVNNAGNLQIVELPEEGFYPFSGQYLSDPEALIKIGDMTGRWPIQFGLAWDFVPGQDAVVLAGYEDMIEPAWAEYTGLRPEFDGYSQANFNQLWYVDLKVYEYEERGRQRRTLQPPEKMGQRLYEPGTIFPIPNTLRGIDPAVSPDGRRIAFFEYGDGTLNLAIINIDGSDKRYVTNYDDGTWLQRVDWSPDGKQLVATVFRNYQQDIFIVDAESGSMKPIMWDSHEDFDAHWGWDGRIYFSSDPTGIFNLFSYDPKSGAILQLTNVIGGAQQPWLTPDGNLLFVNFTAHGFKIWGLPEEEFMNKPANHLFNTQPDPQVVSTAMAYTEDLSMYAEATHKYQWARSIMPPTAAPMIRYSNDSQSNWGIQGGFQVYAQDFVEKHVGVFQALLGEDVDLLAQYFNQSWYPNIMLYARHIEAKFDFAYALDADGDYNTTDDRDTYEGKNAQVADIGAVGIFYPWNGRTTLGLFGQALAYGFKTTSDDGYQPFMVSASTSAFLTYTTISDYYNYAANPPPGKSINLTYNRGYSDIVYASYYGVDVDDGELLDAYGFNQVQLDYTQHFSIKPIGGFDPLGVLSLAQARGHRFQLSFQGGAIDRNVQFNDEFRAGGRHPYFWGSGAISPNTMFAGYPPSSLSGETMLMLSAAYRFPVKTKINKKIGPLYVYDIHAQVMGTAGNLWSYRPPTEPGSYYYNRYDARVAYDPTTIEREIPFKSYSYKNSPVGADGQIDPNYLLYDAGAELRVSSTLWRGYWNSFVRVAYGFNEIRGVGDVNGDDVIDTSDSTLGDSLSNESERGGVRVYIGLGTGW